jgi:hypothetical protein
MRLTRTLAPALLVAGLASCSSSGPPTATEPSAAPSPAPTPAVPAGPRFVDVAESAGLKTVLYCGGPDKDHILESVGTGAAFIDFDEDGRQDVYLVNAWALDEDRRASASRAATPSIGTGGTAPSRT